MRMADLMSADVLPSVRIPTLAGVRSVLWHLAGEYPASLVAAQERDIPRVTYHVRLALCYAPPYPTICDVGGGISLFSLAVAALGYPSVLVGDFGDRSCVNIHSSALQLHRRYGVKVISRDMATEGINLPSESADVITSFSATGCFHNGPNRCFRQFVEVLRPGGILVLCGPNGAGLRERLAIPSRIDSCTNGKSAQAIDVSFTEEPGLLHLRAVCRDFGLQMLKVAGRNWQSRYSSNLLTRFAVRYAGWALQRFPCACSDVYVVARKPLR